MTSNKSVTVFGAYGHTGRFVVSEPRRRGWTPILSGRDPDKLNALGDVHPGLESRRACVHDPASLDRALVGATSVINCAGPFARTSAPVIEAALRAQIPYLDVAAEIETNADTFEHYGDRARDAGIVLVPAMAFFGGLGDLLATAAMGDWEEADAIDVMVGFDRWHATQGTRNTIARNSKGNLCVESGRLTEVYSPPPQRHWTFAEPVGAQEVIELPFAKVPLISRHLKSIELHTYLS